MRKHAPILTLQMDAIPLVLQAFYTHKWSSARIFSSSTRFSVVDGDLQFSIAPNVASTKTMKAKETKMKVAIENI